MDAKTAIEILRSDFIDALASVKLIEQDESLLTFVIIDRLKNTEKENAVFRQRLAAAGQEGS